MKNIKLAIILISVMPGITMQASSNNNDITEVTKLLITHYNDCRDKILSGHSDAYTAAYRKFGHQLTHQQIIEVTALISKDLESCSTIMLAQSVLNTQKK